MVNPLEPNENKIYMTFDSMKENFLKVFGYKNDFFMKMFYYLFSKGYDSYTVWLLDWINELYPFYKFDMSKIAERTYWMYDTSRDGELSLADLIHAQACCPSGC